MPVKFLVDEGFEVPKYQTSGAAGFDLVSAEDVVIQPGEHKLVKTPYHVVIPTGYEGQIRPRSGMALKQGVTVLNAPGTIDSDYRGRVGVILWAKDGVIIKKGDRIAQMVISSVERAFMAVISKEEYELESTVRAEGGFGSTGG